MRHSDDLFRLIQSLGKSEKRYFKLFASMQGGDKKYLLLFDAIDRQERYDEKALKEEFCGETFIRQFGVAKGYLYNLILKSLRLYHSGSSVTAQIRELLTNIDLLNDRGLNDQALKMHQKLVALATKHEKFLALIAAANWEATLMPDFRKSNEGIEECAERQRELLAKLQNFLDYNTLLHKISRIIIQDHVRTPDEWEDLHQIMRHPLLTGERGPLSVRGEFYYHWVFCVYHYARNEFSEALQHAKEMTALLERDPDWLSENFTLYLATIGNSLTLQRQAGYHDEFFRTVKGLRSIAQEFSDITRLNNPRVTAHIFQTSYLYLLALYVGRAEFREAIALASEVNEGLKRHGEYLNDNVRFKFYHNLALSYFALGEYDTALDYINRILTEKEPPQGQHTYYACRLLNLIIHYELENTSLLESLVPSTYRYLLSREGAFRLEREVIGFFRKLPRIVTRSQLMEEFISLRDTMLELEQDPLEQNAFRYFGYVEWLESKIQGRSYAELSREHLMVHVYP